MEMAQEAEQWNDSLELNYSLVRWQQRMFFGNKWNNVNNH